MNDALAGEKERFFSSLSAATSDEEVLDLCRRHVLHGTPFVFAGNEEAFYRFRKRIADKFEISFHEVYITGSAKLGFSAITAKPFDLDSDIDVALVAPGLYERIMREIYAFQMALRESRKTVTERELAMYHSFLEYTAIGWIRPDKLPLSFTVGSLKADWFDFFRSLSYGGSEAGNYKVGAGVFMSYPHLEQYQFSGLQRVRKSRALTVAK